jgi:DNA-binding CsgD family transcriptional regulator
VWPPWLVGTSGHPSATFALTLLIGLLVLLSAAELIRSGSQRAQELRRSREEELRRRASENRMRMARDLHDVVAHNISVINVQANTALHLMDRQPQRAREALTTINEVSRQALAELRSVLGVLRSIDEGGVGQDAPRAPAPSLDRVDELAATMRAAGLAAAARFAQENSLGPDDEPDYARESGHLVLARVLLAQDRPGQALALLDRLHETASGQDRAGSLIEIGALRALARAATGDKAGAVAALAEALLLACPQGHVRVFADEGALMAALLGRLIAGQRTGQAAAGVPLGYLARLQRAFDTGPSAPDHRPGTAAVRGIVDPLTSRELEVLTMLAGGRSNQAIARELVVTLDTVKKHVSHVLGKLGAANRTEAVARAHQLALIP